MHIIWTLDGSLYDFTTTTMSVDTQTIVGLL